MAFAVAVDKQIETGSLISRFLTNLKKLGKDKLTLSVYETRLELLETYWTRFRDHHNELFGHKDYPSSDYARNDLFVQTQETYLDTKAYFRDRIRELSTATNSSRSDTSKPTVSTGRLPKISLPTFSGSYLEWESFRDLFISLVHEAPDITNVARLHYLKSSVTGEAAKLISGISITDANYEGAWRALVQRYDDKGLILAHHFNQLLALRAIDVESAANLKHLLDTTSVCRRGMQNLGRPVQYWDDWFVHLTVLKLDHASRKGWETTRGVTKDLPTFMELTDFMNSRIRALESVPPSSMKTERARSRGLAQTYVRSHATNMPTTSSFNVNQSCDLCSQKHYIGYCPEFKHKSPQERRTLIEELRRCLNCLRQHQTKSCPSLKKCLECGSGHHTLLHADVSDNLTPAPTISTAHAQTSPTGVDRSTLLATAIVRVTAYTGQSTTIRALLDQGSEATFISEDLAQRLRLPRTKVNVPVTGMGAAHCGTVKALVHVQLSSDLEGYPTVIQATAFVLPNLLKAFHPLRASSSSWPHLESLKLSDVKASSPSQIDLVIGADLYGDILLDGLVKGTPGSPVAQQTIFGWVLSGKVEKPLLRNQRTLTTFHCSIDLTLMDELRRFGELEEVTQYHSLTPEEQYCEEKFRTTHGRTTEGRFVLPRLSRRSNVVLGHSRAIALRALHRKETRRQRDEALNHAYKEFMGEYIRLGHMKPIPKSTLQIETFYLPHHAVRKKEGENSKLERLLMAGGFELAKWPSNVPELTPNSACNHFLTDGLVKTLDWDEVPPHEKEKLSARHMSDGEFWISYSDFMKTFTHLEIVHLDNETSRDELSLPHKTTWQMRIYSSAWQKSVSARGCRNNPDTFHINPQLHLILSENEEVVLSLNQHSIMEPKVIGLTAYSLPKNNTEIIGKQFFKKNKSLANSQYTNSRQVSHRCPLQQGGYLILPTTFELGQQSNFILRVFSSKPLRLKLLDTALSFEISYS